MSNLSTRRAVTGTLATTVNQLSKIKEDAEFSAKAAEQRFKTEHEAKEVLGKELSQTAEALHLCQTERKHDAELAALGRAGLEERIATLEKMVADERAASGSRDVLHAEQVASLQRDLSSVSAERASLQEQLTGVMLRQKEMDVEHAKMESQLAERTEEHAKVERELSAASARVAELEQGTADYRKDEELHRLSEGRLREQLSAVQAHVLCTDERCRELSKMREQAYEERLRAQDEAKAAMSAAKALEEQLAVIRQQQQGAEESAKSIAQARTEEKRAERAEREGIETRCRELQLLNDKLQQENGQIGGELTRSSACIASMEEQVEALLVERRHVEEFCIKVLHNTKASGMCARDDPSNGGGTCAMSPSSATSKTTTPLTSSLAAMCASSCLADS